MGLRDKWSDIKKNVEEKMSYTVPEKRLHEKSGITKSVEALFTLKQYQEMMGCSDDSKKEYPGYPTKEEYEEKINRSTYNLNLTIDDIPLDEEIHITIGQANEQPDLDNDGPTLTLRRNKINNDIQKNNK